jgi:cell division protein FtsB
MTKMIQLNRDERKFNEILKELKRVRPLRAFGPFGDWTEPREAETAWDALQTYLVAASEIGRGALVDKALEIRRSIPALVREYKSLETATNSTNFELKKRMYEQEMRTMRNRLTEISELFSTAYLELGKELGDEAEHTVHTLVSDLSATGKLEEHLEEVRALTEGLMEAKELTPLGADALAREIDALNPPTEIIALPVKTRIAPHIEPAHIPDGYTFYSHERVRNEYGGTGFAGDVENHLRSHGMIRRCLSLDNQIVKDWLENPATYPVELRGRVVLLWKSVGNPIVPGHTNRVASLHWYEGNGYEGRNRLDDRLVVEWQDLGKHAWGDHYSTLLAG